MGLLDNYTGIGMSPRPSREHQRVLAKILKEMGTDYDDYYEVLLEQCIDPNNLNSPAPDIVVFDLENDEPVLFIEVTTNEQRKAISDKVIDLLNAYPSVKEAFVYDYEAKAWKRYANRSITDISFSELLDLSFDEIINF